MKLASWSAWLERCRKNVVRRIPQVDFSRIARKCASFRELIKSLQEHIKLLICT